MRATEYRNIAAAKTKVSTGEVGSKNILYSTPAVLRQVEITLPHRWRQVGPAPHSKGTGSLCQSSDHPTVPGDKPCGIRACGKTSCRLESHRRYVQEYRARTQPERSAPLACRAQGTDVISRTRTSEPTLQKTISSTMTTAGCPRLPLGPWARKSSAVFHYLFRNFFAGQLDQLLRLVVIPFHGYKNWAEQKRQQLLEVGMEVELDCLSFIGAAYIYAISRPPSSKAWDVETGILVHSRMLSGLRSILNGADSRRDVGRVLSIMYILVMFDLLFSNPSNLTLLGHKKAMTSVVESCGGLHNCGSTIPFIVNFDRLIATVAEMEPVYGFWEHVKLPTQRAPKYAAVYGSLYDVKTDKSDIHKDVISYCSEICRAIEILEGEAWDFNDTSANPNGEVYYLYYLRERLSGQFVFLNARATTQNTVTRCVLLTAKLVEYTALWNSYNGVLVSILAERLMNLLIAQDLMMLWHDRLDMLKWILFTLVSVYRPLGPISAVFEWCCQTLCTLYMNISDVDWRHEQSSMLTKFVWSCAKLNDGFTQACKQLETEFMTKS